MNPQVSPSASSATLRIGKASVVSSTIVVWLLLIVYLVIVKIILDLFLPNAFADPAQAALFGWGPIAVYTVLGFVGAWLSTRTDFPAAWGADISAQRRVLYPILAGFAFAVVLVVVDMLTGYTKLVAARHGVTQQYTGFVPMLLIFTAAPIIVEVVCRLFLVPVLLWLISNVILRGRAQSPIFWVLAVLTSLLEPFTQFPDIQVLPVVLALFVGVESFAFNFTQAAFWRKYGLLAAVLVRVGFYFIWHVIYVH